MAQANKYYSIKHIETRGVMEVEILPSSSDNKYIAFIRNKWSFPCYERLNRDIFERREDAVAAGVTKLLKAAASAEKRAEKLRKMAEELVSEAVQ